MGILIPGMSSVFSIFLIRQFMMSISDTLFNADRIDDVSDFKIYFKIVLPLCKLMLISLQDIELMMAGSVITVMPIIIIFTFVHNMSLEL